MSARNGPKQNLIAPGKTSRSWFVVADAGERDGIRYWRCMCRVTLAERIIAESEILDKEVNSWLCADGRLGDSLTNPSGWIYGEWTVIGPTGEYVSVGGRADPIWRCRCTCGTEKDIARDVLTRGWNLPFGSDTVYDADWNAHWTWGSTLSCGCRTDAEVRAELQKIRLQARKRRAEDRGAAKRREMERKLDKKWTVAMDRALRNFQPACVLCGYTGDLTAHHVRPLSVGSGKKPGNIVRLCRFCNSLISSRTPRNLPPEIANALKTAAAQFKEFWNSGCATSEARTPVLKKESSKAPDPALVALLGAMESGDDGAIATLANWLEKRGDPRAAGIWDVTRLKVCDALSNSWHSRAAVSTDKVRVTITQREGSDATYSAQYRLDGKWRSIAPWVRLTPPGDCIGSA
jgi:5-methylcytosine-specific restriction endonuclease McrA